MLFSLRWYICHYADDDCFTPPLSSFISSSPFSLFFIFIYITLIIDSIDFITLTLLSLIFSFDFATFDWCFFFIYRCFRHFHFSLPLCCFNIFFIISLSFSHAMPLFLRLLIDSPLRWPLIIDVAATLFRRHYFAAIDIADAAIIFLFTPLFIDYYFLPLLLSFTSFLIIDYLPLSHYIILLFLHYSLIIWIIWCHLICMYAWFLFHYYWWLFFSWLISYISFLFIYYLFHYAIDITPLLLLFISLHTLHFSAFAIIFRRLRLHFAAIYDAAAISADFAIMLFRAMYSLLIGLSFSPFLLVDACVSPVILRDAVADITMPCLHTPTLPDATFLLRYWCFRCHYAYHYCSL